MRTIGLIGGMSWESTAVYYRYLNEAVRTRLGGLASADVLLRSVNFADIVALQTAGRWDEAANILAGIARGLEQAGAGCLLICTNTMHKLADEVQAAVSVPLIHIVDVTGAALQRAGARRPLLLATRYTMEQEFYAGRMRERCGITPMIPDAQERADVHRIIFEELCCGLVRDDSRRIYQAAIERAARAGADSVILGCTEIGLLLSAGDCALPAFDSTLLHAEAAVEFALAAQEASAAA
jgi:aspartate racemase